MIKIIFKTQTIYACQRLKIREISSIFYMTRYKSGSKSIGQTVMKRTLIQLFNRCIYIKSILKSTGN